MGSLIFVHGTGVRLKDYLSNITNAKKLAKSSGLSEIFVECAWGDALGVEFEGKSLPDPPSPEKLKEEEADFAEWNWQFEEPLFYLNLLTLRDSKVAVSFPMPGVKPDWQKLWDQIAAYQPSKELCLLLERGAISAFWPDAWSQIMHSPIPRLAFEASAHELPEASRALARALVAQLHVCAVKAKAPAPSRALRTSLCMRLLADWKQEVYGLGDFFAKFVKHTATQALRNHRGRFSDAAALPVGDILLYQSRGHEVREFIRYKIEHAEPPVTLVAHSLGGIACVDLLALPNAPKVDRLVTAGSQSPLLYEIGALYSLKPPQPLPQGFPPWLNLYDRNDFLSYVAGRLWPTVVDVEIESGQPFPDSHSAYFGNDHVWQEIRQFMIHE